MKAPFRYGWLRGSGAALGDILARRPPDPPLAGQPPGASSPADLQSLLYHKISETLR